MSFKFEELEIIINAQKFFVSGEIILDLDPQRQEFGELMVFDIEIMAIFNENGTPMYSVSRKFLQDICDAIEKEFYKPNSELYDDALAFWEDQK